VSSISYIFLIDTKLMHIHFWLFLIISRSSFAWPIGHSIHGVALIIEFFVCEINIIVLNSLFCVVYYWCLWESSFGCWCSWFV